MNPIKRMNDLQEEAQKHQGLLLQAVTRNLFYTAKHECDACINIEKKIAIIINKERVKS